MPTHAIAAAVASLAVLAGTLTAAAEPAPSTSASTTYQSVTVDGVKVFYREAGPPGAPTVLLLHGYPSSSRMFATLIPLLADRYHLVAPDYPGFGLSDAPDHASFAYTFDHLATVVDHFTTAAGLKTYVLYLADYGGPVGFRLALAHPERVRAIVVQNAVAHEDGLGPAWALRRAFWRDRAANEDKVIGAFTSLEGAMARHLGSTPHPERYDPEAWLDEYAFLSRPGERRIQSDLFFDYQSNVAAYPAWQAWLRKTQPPLLVVWGRYDPSFALAEAEAYRRDVPGAEIHILDGGHFALDERVDDIAADMRAFLARLPAN
jgi:pimeloyl-ACP methyl ester carboxylesterase